MPIIHKAPAVHLHNRQQKTDPFGYEKYPGSVLKATGPNKDGRYRVDAMEKINPKFHIFNNFKQSEFEFDLVELHGWKKAFQIESLAVTEENPMRPHNHV